MMDADPLYPHGFHPLISSFQPDGKTVAWPRSRTPCPVKYYYIDFGISVKFPPEAKPEPVTGAYGRDREVPELSWDIPYDPFKTDIFILGNVFRKCICTVSPSFCLLYVSGTDRICRDSRTHSS